MATLEHEQLSRQKAGHYATPAVSEKFATEPCMAQRQLKISATQEHDEFGGASRYRVRDQDDQDGRSAIMC